MRGKNKGKFRGNKGGYFDEEYSDYYEEALFGMSPVSRSAPLHVMATGDWRAATPPKAIKPRNEKQAEYLRMLNCPNTHIILATGCAGTGKTFVGVSYAMEKLLAGEIKKIVITRPIVAVDDKHFGALPGTKEKKMEPWLMPIWDIVHKYITPGQAQSYMEKGVIEICPLMYMRGRSFEHCFIIADEMQNSSVNQMLMLLTRIGEGSKMVVDGDPMQHDRGYEYSGLVDLMEKLKNEPQDGIGMIHFTEQEVERHPMVKKVLRLYHARAVPDM